MPHSSVLSELERRRIRAFLRADGERTSAIRGLATRCKQNLARIEEDLTLMKQLLERYGKAREDRS